METPYKLITLLILSLVGFVNAQEETVCYGPGSIAASVILTFLLTVLLIWAVYYWKNKRRAKTDHLILETDPEKGKGEFAFDNPGFKEATFISNNKTVETPQDRNKSKWTQWSPLSVLNVKTEKQEKKRSMDDLALEDKEVKVISLRSEDFTGLGFNICGNMREGIYVKDVLHRGPAYDSGKLNSGDRINSVTINFEHMVYEDALNILSYASPYEVVIEAKGGKLIHNVPGQGGQPGHPLYKSSSHLDLHNVDKSTKKNDSNYSSLKKSISNMTTLERKESPKKLNLEQLEQKIDDHLNNKLESDIQKTENKLTKFGVRVLPVQISPKSAEQNDNNINIEKHLGIDEVDKAPPIKKREKKTENNFQRNNSGIKRDKEGIPLELPEEMWQAATAVMNNRKSAINFNEEDPKVVRRKSKAPPTPDETKLTNYDEIQQAKDEDEVKEDITEVSISPTKDIVLYNSDSDGETDNNSSVNTIELNSSDITIHQTEEEERQNRKTVSTGDLTKIKDSKSPNTGTLERAQSLDISDSTIPTLSRKRKVARNDDDFMKSDEDLFKSELLDKEPRLSLILDGLNTFQRSRLKKSSEWGHLEDAILKVNQDDETGNEYTAVVNKINEIKRESEEVLTIQVDNKKVKNEIWPEIDDNSGEALNITPTKSYETLDDLETDIIEEELIVPKNPVNNRINEPFERNKRQRVPDITAEPLPDPPLPHSPEIKHSPEEVLSKIPLLNSMVKEEALKQTNITDETKTVVNLNSPIEFDVKEVTQNFLFTEQINAKSYDLNVSDDIKVSRHSYTPESDDSKHVSNVSVSNGDSELHSLEFTINDSQMNLTTPDLIKNVSLTEAINTVNNEENKHTYITEIKVTPNISEIKVDPDERNLDKDFENYVKSFEAKLEHFENNINQFDKNLDDVIIEEPQEVEIVELDKIQKIAEQQLKKLPEMKFTTSSYESSKIPDKRNSYVEQLKCNFEKSPSKLNKLELSTKSRIPIATTTKTPPTSPERRDSRTLDNENDKAILELMSSSIKPPNKNVTVTSIRTSSKIPSGLPTLGGARTPRKIDLNDENVVQVSTNGNGNIESSFKQWVFNPSNVTNVTVTQSKDDRK